MSDFLMPSGTLDLDIDIKFGIEGARNPMVPLDKQDFKPVVIRGFIKHEKFC